MLEDWGWIGNWEPKANLKLISVIGTTTILPFFVPVVSPHYTSIIHITPFWEYLATCLMEGYLFAYCFLRFNGGIIVFLLWFFQLPLWHKKIEIRLMITQLFLKTHNKYWVEQPQFCPESLIALFLKIIMSSTSPDSRVRERIAKLGFGIYLPVVEDSQVQDMHVSKIMALKVYSSQIHSVISFVKMTHSLQTVTFEFDLDFVPCLNSPTH